MDYFIDMVLEQHPELMKEFSDLNNYLLSEAGAVNNPTTEVKEPQ